MNGLKILVVDDTPLVRELTSDALVDHGFAVTAVDDGSAALEHIGSEAVDLVVLDILMPGLSGLDVLSALREQHSAAHLPVIMASAMDASEDLVGALALGANDYVTKPIDFEILRAKIARHLDVRELWRRTARLEDEVEFQRAELESIIETSPNAIVTHHRGSITMANGATAQITGYPVDDLVRMELVELLVDPAEVERVAATSRSFQCQIRTREGSVRLVDIRTRRLPRDAHHDLELVNAVDITDWVALKEKMASAEKDAAVNQLADRAAHEIRNNMQAPRAMLDLGRKAFSFLYDTATSSCDDASLSGRMSRTHQRFLDQVDEAELALERIRAIVDRMQGFSFDRVEYGTHELHALIDRCVPAGRVAIERSYDPALVEVECDAFQLDMVFRNLFKNAVEAVEAALPEGGQVVVTTRALDGEAMIRFEDDGAGFSASALTRAVEPGFTTKTERIGGHGFGLYICRTVTEAHGGRFSLSNGERGGAAIEIVLPTRR